MLWGASVFFALSCVNQLLAIFLVFSLKMVTHTRNGITSRGILHQMFGRGSPERDEKMGPIKFNFF